MHLWLCCILTYILLSHTTCAHVHIRIYTHKYTITHTNIIFASADYESVSMTLGTFTSQQPRQCFNVSITNDAIVESNETFTARLTLASVTTITANEITIDPSETTVLITDNDYSKLSVVRVPRLKPHVYGLLRHR